MKNPLIPNEADALIMDSATKLPTIQVPVEAARRAILHEELRADRPFPPFDRVTMDGIAFRHDGNRSWNIAGIHPAGAPVPPSLPAGSCWQIMTGAILPPDCNTVVPYEEIIIKDNRVEVLPEATIHPGRFIHREGSDCPAGTVLVHPPVRLTPSHLAIAASIGASSLTVTRPPRIALFSSGDELVPISNQPLPHQIRRSNDLTLRTTLESWGIVTCTCTHLPDALDATTETLRTALHEYDILLISGGISKGKKDFIRPAVENLVGPSAFHGVLQRPGKPMAFWPGGKDRATVFALPGNPNSTLTTCCRYVLPFLNAISGLAPSQPRSHTLSSPAPTHPKLTQFLPARENHHGALDLLITQNSGDFVAALEATHLAEIPPGSDDSQSVITWPIPQG